MTEGRKRNAVQDWIPVETTRMTEGRKYNAVQDWIPVEATRMTEGCGISYAIGALAGSLGNASLGNALADGALGRHARRSPAVILAEGGNPGCCAGVGTGFPWRPRE